MQWLGLGEPLLCRSSQRVALVVAAASAFVCLLAERRELGAATVDGRPELLLNDALGVQSNAKRLAQLGPDASDPIARRAVGQPLAALIAEIAQPLR